jgi:disulfide bond formation protein DsbB
MTIQMSPGRALARATSLQIAGVITLVAFATIAGAWVFEAAGYLPCELCLKQRWAYYAGVPVAALTTLATASGPRWLARAGLWLLALIFIASAVFGAYHAGVEWGFWPGPTDCTGTLSKASSMDDFMKQLNNTRVVRCDAVAIRILGLSLAGWNAVISAGLAFVSVVGARRSYAAA